MFGDCAHCTNLFDPLIGVLIPIMLRFDDEQLITLRNQHIWLDTIHIRADHARTKSRPEFELGNPHGRIQW